MQETLSAEVERRLKAIRADPERLMRYDLNGDGIVDDEEWEEVRQVVRAEVHTEARRSQIVGEGDALLDDAADEVGHTAELLRGRYEGLRLIGRGGQGRTYAGFDGQTREKVAIKELDLRQAQDWKAIELFEREARVLEGLSHPAIPSYVDAFHLQDEESGEERFFLVQEFVDGEPLDALIDRGFRVDEAQARDLLKELLLVLDYLHGLASPVIHRDIKPSNIMRRVDGSLALIDFGAVQAVLPGEKGASTVVGTSGYMPLEQLMGRSVPATDLYALGATMIHLLSHRHPSDLPVRAMALQFEEFIQVSPAFEALLRRMTAPHVEDRYSSVSEVLRELKSPALNGAAASAMATARASASASSWETRSSEVARTNQSFSGISPFEEEPRLGSRIYVDASVDSLHIEFPAIKLHQDDPLLLGVGIAPFVGVMAIVFAVAGSSLFLGACGFFLILIPLVMLFRFLASERKATLIVDAQGLHLRELTVLGTKKTFFAHRIPTDVGVGFVEAREGKEHVHKLCLHLEGGGRLHRVASDIEERDMMYVARRLRHALAAFESSLVQLT